MMMITSTNGVHPNSHNPLPSPAHSEMAERHDHKGKEVGDYQQHPVMAEMNIVKDWRQKYSSGKLVLTHS